MKTVYTGGTFDLFHPGHVNLLAQCKKIGDRVVVALNTDEFVARYKKQVPIWNFQQREIVLRACRYVDDVIPNVDGEDSKPTILSVRPDFIVIGSDWATKDYYAQMNFTQTWLDDNNITLLYVPYTQGVSSTLLRQYFQEENYVRK